MSSEQVTEKPQRAPNRRKRFSFGQSTFWTVLGSLLPGSGLLAAGRRRRLGLIVLAIFCLAVLGLAIWAAVDMSSLIRLAVRPSFLIGLTIVLPILALIWVAVIVRTHLDLRPAALTTLQRGFGAALVGVLAFAVVAPMAVASRYSYDQASLVTQVFAGGESKSGTRPDLGGDDPFQDKERVNIALLGADDSADGEEGNIRTDTMMVASINTRTGNTTIVTIPRQTMNLPFPADSPLHEYYPNGFSGYTEAEGMANNLYYAVPNEVPADVLGETDDLGADALKLALGEATGLKVDYYAMINFTGYEELVDALGGITVNINYYVPIGGNTDLGIPPDDQLAPGPDQHLDGFEALWFARGRYGLDDYQRNERQRCSVNAIIEQANPVNLLQRYEAIANASKAMVETDIPQDVLPAIVDLSLKVQSEGEVRSIAPFDGDNALSTGSPDYDELRSRVEKALGESEAPPEDDQPAGSGGDGSGGGDGSEPAETSEPEPSEEPSTEPDDSGAEETAADDQPASENLTDSCAYNAEEAEASTPYVLRN